MKQLLFVLALSFCAFSMNDLVIPNTFVDSGVIQASEFNQNNDSVEIWAAKIVDTLDDKFIRFTDLTTGDTTLTLLKVNTIKSLDTIRGNPNIDSVQGLDILRGNPDIDSIKGNTKIVNVTVDSLKIPLGKYIRCSADNWSTNRISSLKTNSIIVDAIGATTTNSVEAPIGGAGTPDYWIPGAAIGSVLPGMRVSVPVSLTDASASCLTASGTVSADSVRSAKGISATTGNFTGDIKSTIGYFDIDNGFPLRMFVDTVFVAADTSPGLITGKHILRSDTIPCVPNKLITAFVRQKNTSNAVKARYSPIIMSQSTVDYYASTVDNNTSGGVGDFCVVTWDSVNVNASRIYLHDAESFGNPALLKIAIYGIYLK